MPNDEERAAIGRLRARALEARFAGMTLRGAAGAGLLDAAQDLSDEADRREEELPDD